MSAAEGLLKEWRPEPRPDWVEKINFEGRHLDIKALMPINAEHLINTARRNTGLDDFGDDTWIEPFRVLVDSLEREAELNLVGRLMTSADLLANLEARLRVEQSYKAHPEIEQEHIVRPLFILGQPRTGTSALQNVLAADPQNGSIRTFEAWFPAPLNEADPHDEVRRIERAEYATGMWNRVTPEFAAQHEINAMAPTECNLIHALSFRSRTMVHLGQIPSYNRYMAAADIKPAFRYHERILKLLQWQRKVQRWVLKSPDYLTMIPEIFHQYPDAAIVYTHRDPVKAFGSSVSLIGTLQWQRSDTVFKFDNPNSHITDRQNIAALLGYIIDMLESGAIDKRQLMSVSYVDIVKDPIRVAEDVYRYFDIPLADGTREAMLQYVAENKASRQGQTHSYDTGDTEDIGRARELFRRYQEYFDVPNEV